MAYKTFVNGFPLNASELNTYLMSQAVATFANTTARDEAIGSPAEGQIVYIENTASFLWWTGADWESFGTLPTLTANRAIATDGSGLLSASSVTATELGYLSGVTSSIQTQIDSKTNDWKKVGSTSFTAATSVPVNNVFTSTYKIYKIYVELALNSSGANGQMRMRSSGTDNTTSNYNLQSFDSFSSTTASYSALGQTLWKIFDMEASGSSAEVTLFNPFETAKTYVQSHGLFKASQPEINLRSGAFNATTSFDGFTFIPSTGNITGTISVYGLA
jgi:hypothetical protein